MVVAIGGNATHPAEISGTTDEQRAIAEQTAAALLPLALAENQLIITHGNGPVVGKILMRQALARDALPPMSLDICVAHSQGGIAYLLLQALENALRRAGSARHVACLLTQVEVAADDPAFDHPSKPVGPYFEAAEAERVGTELGWTMREEAGGRWRHVVPSPTPLHICDISLIEELSSRGSVVIAGGGGGIPVVRHPDGTRHGVSAVVDKDLTSALMANVLGIPDLLILSAVPRVAVAHGTAAQRDLTRIDLAELRQLQAAGEFPPGSMGPKMEAAARFLEGGGERVAIGHLFQAMEVWRGGAGTVVTRH